MQKLISGTVVALLCTVSAIPITQAKIELIERFPDFTQEASNGTYLWFLRSRKSLKKFIPCDLDENQVLGQRYFELKKLQGAPKTCREDMVITQHPYLKFSK